MMATTFDRNEAMAALGNFIRARRRELGLTQTQLGARIGYYQERISALECGSYGVPSLQSMHELAVALEVPIERLLGEIGGIPDAVRADARAPEQATPLWSEQTPRLREQYDAVCRQVHMTEDLANEMVRLREQMAHRRMELRRITASCTEMVR